MTVSHFLEPLVSLSMRACETRDWLEREIIRVLLCDPAGGIETLKSLGVSYGSFDVCSEYRFIFLACEAFAHHGRDVTLRAAIKLLQMERMAVGVWAPAAFTIFADSFCDFPTPVQKRVLIELKERLDAVLAKLRDAREYEAHARRLLSPRRGPDGAWDYRQ